MKRIALGLAAAALCLTACTSPKGNPPPAAQQPPAPNAREAPPAREPPPSPSVPDLPWTASRAVTRDQIRDGLVQVLNNPGADPATELAAVFEQLGAQNYGPPALPYAEADLDGDGRQEYVMALAVTNPTQSGSRTGAALFVIYRKDGQWAVDRSDPMSQNAEAWLMAPALHGVADLAGLGYPQIIWSRPAGIATGLGPMSFFVTVWQPGRLTDLPGAMAISRTMKDPVALAIEGMDLVLTGASRHQMFLPPRTDRYRLGNGAFRLIDRRFLESGDTGYDRLWDALVAEDVGRTADAEQAYREAADPNRKARAATVQRYNQLPVELSPADLERFGQALRTLARFRLGALLKEAGRESEAAAVSGPVGSPYPGLLSAIQGAPNRAAGCQAAAAWAEAHPEFLAAFNLGVSDEPWEPRHLCGHVSLEETLPGEDR